MATTSDELLYSSITRLCGGQELNVGEIEALTSTLSDTNKALLVRAIMAGKDTTGAYRNMLLDASGNLGVFFNTGALDAFGRLRTSTSVSLFGYTHAYSKGDLLWNEATTGTASSAHSNVLSSVVCTVGTASGDEIIRQTKHYARYIPGKTSFCTLAFSPGARKTNLRRRWGSFHSDSGFFFQQTSSNLSVVLRQYLSGSVVDIVTNQADWNQDKLDGTGKSGVTIDETKHNVFVIDYSWHGSGLVRFGVLYGGVIIYCHEQQCSNTFAGPYCRYPAHPIRYEMTNLAATASSSTLQFTACSANKEGNEIIEAPYQFSTSTEATSKTISSTRLPVLSIRLNPTFNGVANRIVIEPTEFEIFAEQNAGYVCVLLNPTLTGASWVNVNTESNNAYSSAQKDVSATAVSGGTVLYETYTPAGSKGASTGLKANAPALLANNIAGTASDVLTVCFKSFGGNTSIYGKIAFMEYQ